MRTRILVTGLELDEPTRFLGQLLRAGHELELKPWADDLVDLVLEVRFDAIVVGTKVRGAALARFLSAVRSAESESRHAGVVLVANLDQLPEVSRYVGHGVNRVVGTDTPHKLGQTVSQLLQVAPRVDLQTPARIAFEQPEQRVAALCQTANISASGMLVRGFARQPVGTVVDFALHLPGDEKPLHGSAEVCRRSVLTRERIQGFGARFLAFEGHDGDRLMGYLETRLD